MSGMSSDETMSIELDGEEARRFVRVLYTLYGALAVSLAIYVIIAFVVVGRAVRERPWERPVANPALFWVFVGLAIATTVVIPVIRRRILPRAARRAEGVTRAPRVPAVRALGKYMSGQIVSWALCEAIGVYGLVLAFVTYEPLYTLGFVAAAAANLVVYAPRRAHVQAILYAVATGGGAGLEDPRRP